MCLFTLHHDRIPMGNTTSVALSPDKFGEVHIFPSLQPNLTGDTIISSVNTKICKTAHRHLKLMRIPSVNQPLCLMAILLLWVFSAKPIPQPIWKGHILELGMYSNVKDLKTNIKFIMVPKAFIGLAIFLPIAQS